MVVLSWYAVSDLWLSRSISVSSENCQVMNPLKISLTTSSGVVRLGLSRLIALRTFLRSGSGLSSIVVLDNHTVRLACSSVAPSWSSILALNVWYSICIRCYLLVGQQCLTHQLFTNNTDPFCFGYFTFIHH